MSDITFPSVELNIYKAKSPVEATIVESSICTATSSPNFIRHITFDVSNTDLEGRVYPGQSLGVMAPGLDENGKPHKVRLYSVSSPHSGEDGAGKWYSTTVKRVIDEHWETQELFTGVCSNYLCSLKKGDKVLLTGPSGKRFILPENPKNYNYIFFATGTGIAPFRSMALELLKSEYNQSLNILFGCPYRTDIIYKELFNQLDKENDNVNYFTAVSREESRSNGGKLYVQHLTDKYKQVLKPVLEKENTLIYVCGLKGMEIGIYDELVKLGLTDYFILPEGFKKDDYDLKSELFSKLKPAERFLVETY